jgi:hypothetical protein
LSEARRDLDLTLRGRVARPLPLVVVFFTFAGMSSRRFAHGASRRPPHARQGNGYGRPARPGPSRWACPAEVGALDAVGLDEVIAALVVGVDLVREERGEVGSAA